MQGWILGKPETTKSSAFGAQQAEASMRRLLAMTAAIFLFGCGSGFAQTAPTLGMGATSPLGTMNFNAPSGPVGIPLGATELNTGGMSPLAGGTLCTGTAASSGGTADRP